MVGISNNVWDEYGSTINLSGAQTQIDTTGDTVKFTDGTSGNSVLFYNEYGNELTSGAVLGSNGSVSALKGSIEITGDDDTLRALANISYNDDTYSVNGKSELFDCSAPAFGAEHISGFNSTDVIQVSKDDAADWQALQGLISQSGSDTLISLNSGTIDLADITASTLTAGEFKFV